MRVEGYTLIEALGRGATGEVWRGTSPAGSPVAVKLIASARGRVDQLRRSFRREVEAMARLRHRNIVTILDIGVLEEETGPRPWLAMELLDGPLEKRAVTHFEELRRVLSDILDGLAHAHARGFLHRDLKPGNVLVAQQDGEVVHQLADFGISHPMGVLAAEHSDEVSLRSAGTPLYMAPEQVTGEWRNWGAWTDLYALGVLAWEFAAGVPPFEADSTLDLARMHLESEPPEFSPRFEVPDAFEGWLRRLLRKAPYTRFEYAADAAWGLAQMPRVKHTREIETRRMARQTLTFLDLPTLEFVGETERSLPKDDTSDRNQLFTLNAGDLPPLPNSWEEPGPANPTASAGLSLLGLRATPFVGRESEREKLWSALRAVRADRTPRFVAIEGRSGRGATSLARWFGHRADELGAARTLWVDPAPGGLRRTLLSMIGAQGLSRREIQRRVEELTEIFGRPEAAEVVAEGLAQLLEPDQHGGVFDRMFASSSREQFASLTRLLRTVARTRPILIVFDDLHESWELTMLVDYLLRDRRRIDDILIVATVEERWSDEERVRRLTMSSRETTTLLRLGANQPDVAPRVLEGLVPLSDDSSKAIVEAVDGDVMDAVLMLFDLAESGRLSEKKGELYAEGEVERMRTEELWLTRLHKMIQSLEDPRFAGRALDAAAAIGRSVPFAEWMRVLDVDRQSDDAAQLDALVDLAVERGVLRRQQDGVAFEHSSARRALIVALEHRPEELRRLHSKIADALIDEEFGSRRLVQHLRRAGRPEDALEIVLDVMRWQAENEDRRNIADIAAELLVAADVPTADSRWGMVALSLVRQALQERDFELAQEHLRRLEYGVEAHGWSELEADALVARGDIRLALGDVDGAYQLMIAGRELALEEGRMTTVARLARHMIDICGMRSKIEEAEEIAADALQTIENDGTVQQAAWIRYALGAAYFHCQYFDEAREEWSKALEIFRQIPDRSGVASALVGLGQTAGALGNYDDAIALAREGVQAFEAIGSHNSGVARLALATYLVFDGHPEAESQVLRVVSELEQTRNPRMMTYGYLLGMAWAGSAGDRDRFDQWFLNIARPFEQYVQGDPDVGRFLTVARDAWLAAGDERRAAQAADLLSTT